MTSPFCALVLKTVLVVVLVVPRWTVEAWLEDMAQVGWINLGCAVSGICVPAKGRSEVPRFLGLATVGVSAFKYGVCKLFLMQLSQRSFCD